MSSNVKRDGKAMGVARTGGYWHSDTSFLQQPIPLTMLTPRIIPKLYRRRTDFIDLSEVYTALPADWKVGSPTRWPCTAAGTVTRFAKPTQGSISARS